MRSLGALLLIALAAGCSDSRSAQLPSAPGQGKAVDPVTIVQPELRTRSVPLETTGKVQFNEEQLVRVNAPVTGRVVEVLARPGDVHLTVSAGVSAAAGEDVCYERLFRAADLALLDAKRQGRNCVVAAEGPQAVVAA